MFLILIEVVVLVLILSYVFFRPFVKMKFAIGSGEYKRHIGYIGEKINGLKIVNIQKDKVIVKWEDYIMECKYGKCYPFYSNSFNKKT